MVTNCCYLEKKSPSFKIMYNCSYFAQKRRSLLNTVLQ